MSLFANDLFSGDGESDGLGDDGDGLSGLEPFELTSDATDGDLAMVLFSNNALEAAMVAPGPAAVMKGLRQMAIRRGIDPNAAVQSSGSRLMVDDRLMNELRTALAVANNMDATVRNAIQQRLAAARSGGAVLPMPSQQAAERSLSAQVPRPSSSSSSSAQQSSSQETLLEQSPNRATSPRWIPYALIGGGVIVAGALLWGATRGRTSTANRRRSRRRKRARR